VSKVTVGSGLGCMRPSFVLAFVLAGAIGGPAEAAAGTCLNDQEKKVCTTLSGTPADILAPSRMGDPNNRTYQKIQAVMRNIGQTATRFVTLKITLDPATQFKADELVVPAPFSCSASGATLNCTIDKLDAGQSLTLTVPAEAPIYAGASTPTSFTVTGTFGWQGKTAVSSITTPVTYKDGSTYVPPGTSPTLYTTPPADDPSNNVTAENPLWASVKLPPKPNGYYARVLVIGDGPAFVCPAGVFLSSADGGPYLCRDLANPARWVELDLGASFGPTEPVAFTIAWYRDLVQALQLPPSAAAPTGTPPWAIFYDQNTGQLTTNGRAFSDTCDAGTPLPPCLASVQQYANGNWSASGYKANDGSDLALAPSPLAPLLAVLDFLVAVADAQLIPPPTIMK
jgi:hypothetical protein